MLGFSTVNAFVDMYYPLSIKITFNYLNIYAIKKYNNYILQDYITIVFLVNRKQDPDISQYPESVRLHLLLMVLLPVRFPGQHPKYRDCRASACSGGIRL